MLLLTLPFSRTLCIASRLQLLPSPLGVIPASFCPSVGSLSFFRTGPPALPLGTPGAGNERDCTPSHMLAQEEGVADLDLVRKRTLRFLDLHCIQRNRSFYSLFLPFVAVCFILVHIKPRLTCRTKTGIDFGVGLACDLLRAGSLCPRTFASPV